MPSAKQATPTVAIVGAGVSGLRCADILLAAGIKVKVFEARHRIGGRVHQIDHGAHSVDLGANWIHSTDGNPILDLAKETDTQLYWRPSDVAIIGSDGIQRSSDSVSKLRSALTAILERAGEYSSQHMSDIDPSLSLMDYVEQEARKQHSDDPGFLADLLEESQRFGLFVGEPMSLQSLKFLAIEEGPGGVDAFVAGTYGKILGHIAKRSLDAGVIQLGTEVTKITTRIDDSGSSVKVEASDGISETFDEIVVTCPLGWLQQHQDALFEPKLTQRLTEAIKNVGYGKLEKLYISFPSAFWQTSPTGKPNARMMHFHDPTYGNYPHGLPSNVVVISLADLPEDCNHPTLLLYLHGPCGTKMVRSIEGLEPGSADYRQTIDEFARPYYSRLPNYSVERDDCVPSVLFASAWQADKWAGNGSYSGLQVGQAHLDADLDVLRDGAGLGESRGLWFAGEHTAPNEYLATTTGAYITGKRAADRILAKWR